METRRLFDFNNDTPENLTMFGGNKDCNGGPSGKATEPILSFWHTRFMGGNHSITVDLYRPSRAAAGAIPATSEIVWTPVWRYDFKPTPVSMWPGNVLKSICGRQSSSSRASHGRHSHPITIHTMMTSTSVFAWILVQAVVRVTVCILTMSI